MAIFAKRLAQLGTENAFRLGADITRCVDRGMDVVRLHLGEPDFDSAPHINEAAIEAIRAGQTHYCDPAGLPAFRDVIAEYVSRTRGLAVHRDRVVVTPGGKPSIGYALQAYVDPGDEVIYPSPGFPIYESWVTYVGAQPVPLPVLEDDGFAVTAENLARVITDRTKLIILNSPANPTGRVLTKTELSALADVIRTRTGPDVRVYSDEIYEHILFDGGVHHSIASEPGMEARTIIASGHSKGFAMTGWRLGYSVLPSVEEAAAFKQLNVNVVSCVPPFVQLAGREALTNPESATGVANMVSAFEARRDWLVAALNDIPGLRCLSPQGAFYVFPNVESACASLGILDTWDRLPSARRRAVSPSGLLQHFLLQRHGVATMDRNSFGSMGAGGQHYLRLSLATSLELLREGVERIKRGVQDPDGCQQFLTGALTQ
ncbi:MAG: pyridoxal phosphate-dependent aminotransferase [Gemmatimonadaceae bacterium]